MKQIFLISFLLPVIMLGGNENNDVSPLAENYWYFDGTVDCGGEPVEGAHIWATLWEFDQVFASQDGYTDSAGIYEIKIPGYSAELDTHLTFDLRLSSVPPEYRLPDTTRYLWGKGYEDNPAKFICHWHVPGNNPPYTPGNPYPPDSAEDVDLNTNLLWSGGDPDGDDVSYNVYLGTSNPPPFVDNTDTTYYCPLNPLSHNTTYYWKIVAIDEYGLQTASPIWTFKTTLGNPPSKPESPNPGDYATGIWLDTTLSWGESTDPDGDPVSYDVYFGVKQESLNYIGTTSSTNFNPGYLTTNTTYYWQIVAKDNTGMSTSGDIWRFTTKTLPEWTVMVYLNADNNLETYGIADMNEMEAGVNGNPEVNVIVQMDRAKGVENDDSTNGNWTTCRRFKILHDTDPDSIKSQLLGDIGEVDMGDPMTLVDFAEWAKDNYPAEKYFLIVWDHGSGWYKGEVRAPLFKGVSFDDSSGNNIGVANGELGNALDSIKSYFGKKLEIIGYDACLMQMWEVMDICKEDANVMVGSEEVETAEGWNYQYFLNELTAYPHEDTFNVAKSAMNYANQYTLSVVDLSKIDTLTSKIDSFASQLIKARANGYSSIIENARDSCLQFQDSTDTHRFIDLYDFSKKIDSLCGSDTLLESLKTSAKSVKNAISSAVYANSAYSAAGGISIYHPKTSSDYNSSYNNLPVASKTQWDEYLQGKGLKPNISIISPIEGENLELGYSYTLRYQSDVWVDYYNIYYLPPGYTKGTLIGNNINTTSWTWQLPEAIENGVKFIVEGSSGGNVGSDTVSVNIGQFTSNSTALSYSNQRKVAVSGDTVHWVYTNGDSVFYAYFDGRYHKRVGLGEGEEPSITLDGNNNPVVVWAKYIPYHSWIILSKFNNGNWTSPDTLYSVSQGISTPGIVITEDTLHLIYRWYHIYPIDGMARSIEYRRYNLSTYAVIDSIILDSGTDIILRNPSITKDNENNIYFVWEKQDSIYYQRLPENKEFIGTGEHPFIDYDKGVINVVWKEGDNITRRRKWVKGDWKNIETIITSGSNSQIKGGSIVLYQDNGVIQKSEWDKVNWSTPQTIDNGILPQTALSGNKLSILYLKPAGSEYQLTLTQTTETFPWGMTDNTLATAPNNQRKIILKDNQLHTVYNGYGKIYYRYADNAECGTGNAEWSEDITIGEGTHPAIASGDVLSFIYLLPDSALKYRYIADTISSEYTIHTGITAPPAITGRGDSIFITAPMDTEVALFSFLYNDPGSSPDLFIKGEHPSLTTDIAGKIHLVYQRNDTIYHRFWGDTIEDTIGAGRNPSINAGDIIDISYQKGDSVYSVMKGLYGEEYDRGSIDIGQNPQGYGYISSYNSDGGVMWQRWDGTDWTDGSRILGTNPQITIEPTQANYTLDIFSYNNIDKVEINQFGNIPYPERIPHLFATDSFGSGLNNANRLIPMGDTLYLAYTSGDNIYLTYSEDKGRGWHFPLLIDKGKYPAMAGNLNRKEIYITYLKDYTPNTGYQIRFTGYSSDLTPLYDSIYTIYERPEEPQPKIGASHIGSPPSIATSPYDYNVHLLWKERTTTDPFINTSEALTIAYVDYMNPLKKEIKGVDEIILNEPPQTEVASPSIAENPSSSNEIYLVWAPFSEGLYFYDSTFVRDTVDLSNVSHPHIDWYNNYLSIVWTKDDTIIKRDRVYDGPVVLSAPPQPQDTTIAGGDEAVVRSSHLLWKTTSGDIQYLYDIFGNYDTTIVQTPALSGYPQEAVIGDTLIYVWTEGNGPYYILSGRHKLQDIDYVYIEDLGKQKPSPFTVYRDTVLSFCSQYYNTMDASQDSLVYQSPHLNPDKWYRIRAYFYQESGDTIPWSEVVSIDGVNAKLVIIPNDSIITTDKLIPKPFYYIDSTIRIKIRKTTGDYAVLSAFMLYQVEKPGTGGPQLAGGRNIPLITKLRGIYPNPFSKATVISYSVSAESGKRIAVSIKVFDILGRIRQTLIDKEQEPGYHRITFKPDKYPTGVYFLMFQAGEYKKTTKMIIVK